MWAVRNENGALYLFFKKPYKVRDWGFWSNYEWQ